MSLFRTNAERIFEAASDVRATGHDASDMTILIGRDGAIHMLAESDWPLESLRLHHGAQMVYRVSQGATVRLEGVAASERCAFESQPMARVARSILDRSVSFPQVTVGAGSSQTGAVTSLRNGTVVAGEIAARRMLS